MTDQEQIAELRRIVTSLVDVLLADASGQAGNWGYPHTFAALANIKSNLLSLPTAAIESSDK
jgi:hypothetical protein